MKALQSEFGIADASVNGNFGPATQRQLAAHILKPGDSGVLVELLSAACVFNGAVPRGEGMVHTMFKSTFDDKLAKYIQAFLSLIHISEPTRQCCTSRMPSGA